MTAIKVFTETELTLVEIWVKAGRVPPNVSFVDAVALIVEDAARLMEQLRQEKQVMAELNKDTTK